MPKNRLESTPGQPPKKSPPPKEPVELTDEFISGRFSLGDAANDEQFDRRKKAKPIQNSTEETPEERALKRDNLNDYTRIALTEENGLEKAIVKWRRDTTEKFLFYCRYSHHKRSR